MAREYGYTTACLVLASTSASYWRHLVFQQATCDFFEGRISHIDPATRAPATNNRDAQALVFYGPRFAAGVVRVRHAKSGELLAEVRP